MTGQTILLKKMKGKKPLKKGATTFFGVETSNLSTISRIDFRPGPFRKIMNFQLSTIHINVEQKNPNLSFCIISTLAKIFFVTAS